MLGYDFLTAMHEAKKSTSRYFGRYHLVKIGRALKDTCYSLGKNIRSNICLDILSYIHNIAIPTKDLGSSLQELHVQIFKRCSGYKIIGQNASGGSDFCIITSKYP